MPFINSKITVKVSDEKKEAIKTRLGQAAAIIGKPESYLMVGFEDEYCLYFAGEKLEKGAFVSVDLFGSPETMSMWSTEPPVTGAGTEETSDLRMKQRN